MDMQKEGRIEEVRSQIVEKLEVAANVVRDKVGQSGEALEQFADSAADKLEASAQSVRRFHPVMTVRLAMRRRPEVTLCVGVVLGLLAGRALTKRA